MSLRIVKEHLPWVAPTAAIVLAATGFIDLSPRDSDPAQNGFEEFAVTRNVAPDPVAAVANVTGIAPQVPSQTTLIQPQTVPAPAPQPVVVAPQPAPVRPPQPVPVSVPRAEQSDPIADPAAFFAAAQANLANDRSCVDDLRALARDARIYFPSGGLTGEEAGMAQARLIGVVAQNCPDIEVVVKGHSDPSGDPNANLRLSQQRADAILQRVAAAGIDVTRFRSVGMGSQEPSRVQGPEPSAYYDRRVEFEIVDTAQVANYVPGVRRTAVLSPCALELQTAVAQTTLFYSPRSITTPSDAWPSVVQLAAAASACPEARLRVIGQYSDDLGSGETPATGRLRALALMNALVAAGYDPEQIIIASPSRPTQIAGQSGVSERRVDFDIILEN